MNAFNFKVHLNANVIIKLISAQLQSHVEGRNYHKQSLDLRSVMKIRN